MAKDRNLSPDIVMGNYSKKFPEDIRYDYSPAELVEMKEQLTDLAIQKSKKETLLADIKQILSKEEVNIYQLILEVVDENETQIDDRSLKFLSDTYSTLLTNISKGYENRQTIVYEIDNSDEGRLDYYDAHGTWLYDRKLAGKRHQMHILSQTKIANDE
jgi:hypothetical protein